MAFQSFQGRSCVTFVRTAMMADFEKQHSHYALTFAVVAPAAAMLDNAPVKTVTFVKPKVLKDKADRHLLGRSADEVEYEVTLRARRRGSIISTYGELKDRFDVKQGYVTFEGQQFEGVKADVKIGSKRRTVGVFGAGYDAGLIDVSDEVERSPSGHPTFESICAEVDGLMDDFYAGTG